MEQQETTELTLEDLFSDYDPKTDNLPELIKGDVGKEIVEY